MDKFYLIITSVLLLFVRSIYAESYPEKWWEEFPREEAHYWEILPQDAEHGEVILSKRIELSKTFDNIKLLNRSQKISLNIQKTPNNKIFLISIKPSNKSLPLLKAYIRDN